MTGNVWEQLGIIQVTVTTWGHTQSYGTENVKEVFQRNKEVFEDALKNDALKLCNDKLDEVSENENATNGKDQAYRLKNGAGLARLPLPLSLMNRREKLTYLRYVIFWYFGITIFTFTGMLYHMIDI